MRIEKSAYEKKIHCTCGCVFYANRKDFVGDGQLYYVKCPQCHHVHSITIGEYCDIFDYNRYRYGEVQIDEVSKTRTVRK